MIRMQYPNITGNFLCDGRIHNITPHSISRIEDLEIFLMEYYDESMGCESSTILYRMPNGEISKIPLLNYELLFEMINAGEIRLTEEDLYAFLAKYYANSLRSCIGVKKPVKDFHQCLTQVRAAIILYIDANGDIYYKDGNNFVKIDGALLSTLMQAYDIEWHRKETNELASKNQIDTAINKTMGYMIKQNDGLSFKERYQIGNIHHYSVSYQYTDVRGFKRGNSSI